MFYLYILRSKRNGKYYIGSTHHLGDRLREHNAGKVRSTKGLLPLEIIYKEEYLTISSARKSESQIKKRKSRKYIESIVKSGIIDNSKLIDVAGP